MSTMYDALRKAEAQRKKMSGGGELKSLGEGGGGGKEKVLGQPKVLLLLVAVVVVFGIAIYRLTAARAAFQFRPSVVSARAMPAASLGVSASGTIKSGREPGTYGLDGVINAGPASMAIVNGRLLKPEQTIDHLILKKIMPGAVEMFNTQDSTTLVLKL